MLYSCPVWVVAYLQEAAKMCRSFVVWRMMMRRRGREIQSVKRIRIQSTAGNFDRAWLPLRSRTQCSAVQCSTQLPTLYHSSSTVFSVCCSSTRRGEREKKRKEKRREARLYQSGTKSNQRRSQDPGIAEQQHIVSWDYTSSSSSWSSCSRRSS